MAMQINYTKFQKRRFVILFIKAVMCHFCIERLATDMSTLELVVSRPQRHMHSC